MCVGLNNLTKKSEDPVAIISACTLHAKRKLFNKIFAKQMGIHVALKRELEVEFRFVRK